MFGRRADGRRLDNIDPIVQIMPYLMTERNDAMNMLTLHLDYDPMMEYIKKRSLEGRKVSFMSLIVAAYVRAVAEYPELNRFVMNKQIFARNVINVSLTVLRNQGDKKNMDEATVKMEYDPDATLDEVNQQMDELIKVATNPKASNDTVNFASKLLKMRWLVKAVVAFARFADKYGVLPKFIYDVSPFHCSMFITNMSSIGLPGIYHHLYNFGNTTVFIALGKFERQPVFGKDGVTYKNIIPLGIVTDERICGGASYAQGFNYFKKLLQNPELLEQRPERINEDYDFSALRAKRKAKKARKEAKKNAE
ncbi:MAG: 2-oxo acid dehydrogenase subunit E2 [Clostridia bacterium]|nr:2-oxo acid dehydrogenase subunit E2 [Clostridia bacterium]